MTSDLKPLTKQDFATLLLDPSATFEERKALVISEFQLTLPEDLEDGDPFIDFVYAEYEKMLKDYELYMDKQVSKKDTSGMQKTSKKQWITDCIQTAKKITLVDLTQAFDDEFHYFEVGKHPRVRIRKTLKELQLINKITIDQTNTIFWKAK